MRCDFHVEGTKRRWRAEVASPPDIGDLVTHHRGSYTVVDVAAFAGEDLLLVTVRPNIDEPALV